MAISDDDLTTLIARVKLIAPSLVSAPDSTMKMLCSDAYDRAVSDGFVSPQLLTASGYMAAHLLTLASDGNQKYITMQKVGDLQQEFQGNTDNDTSFLDEYNRMLDGLFGARLEIF